MARAFSGSSVWALRPFATFANVLQTDADGQVTNARDAGRRASAWLPQDLTDVPAVPPPGDLEVKLPGPFRA